MFKAELFKGKTAIITGGGSGIGKAIAINILQLEGSVIITGRNQEKLDIAAQELNKYGDCQAIACDNRKLEEIENLVKILNGKTIDILVNNAGGQFPSLAEDISHNGWNAVINNNLNGTWYMTQAIAKTFFIPQKKGTIINIIVNIYRGFAGMAHTGAARAGIDNFTKSLAVEWSKYNININAVAPGIIDSTGLENYPDELKKGISDTIPQKRLGTVEEVADLVVFLATENAKYINGDTIYIDGGMRLHGDIFQL